MTTTVGHIVTITNYTAEMIMRNQVLTMQKKIQDKINYKTLQALLSSVVLPLVLLGYLSVSFPSNAADGDTTSTSSSTSTSSVGTSTSTVVDTTTSTATSPVSTNTEITNTTTTLEDLGAGISEQTTVDTHTTTTVNDVTTTTTQTIDTSTPTTTSTTTTTNTTTENHTPNTKSSNYLGNPGFETEKNTGNPSNWTATGNVTVGDTCGPYGGNCLKTGNENTDGGKVSQTVNLFDQMTQAEINEGFIVKYGSQVWSHNTNATVPTCGANPTSDCKDTFSITLTIKDSSGTTLHNFAHLFENISWTGWNTTDFFFNSTVPSNTYTSSLATLELYGIDSGYYSGRHGPQFDNAIVQTVYTAIDFVVSQTINTIIDTQTDVVRSYAVSSATERITTVTNEDISTVVTIVAPIEVETPDIGMDIVEVEVETNIEDMAGGTEIESFEVTVTDNTGSTIDTFEVTTETNLDTGLTEISIEPIEVEMPTTTETVAEVETQIEAQVEAQVEEIKAETTPGGLKPDSQQAEAEPEQVESTTEPESSEPKTEVAESEQEESSSETKTAKAEPKEESDKKDQGDKPKAKASAKNKEEVKKEVATRIVSRIISKLSNDSAAQGTQLALMNIIGADITKNSPNLQDKQDWYTNPVIYTAELRDPYAKLFNIAQDRLHEQLTDLQYN